MLFTKDKLRIALIFIGITLSASGGFLLFSSPKKTDGSYGFRKSLYVEIAATGALSIYAPAMIALGATSFLGAFLLREK